MTWNSGPQITDENGRTVAHGFVLTGDEERGYVAQVIEPLTELQLRYGAIHLIHSDSLVDLITRCKGQQLLKAGIAKAYEQTRQALDARDPA